MEEFIYYWNNLFITLIELTYIITRTSGSNAGKTLIISAFVSLSNLGYIFKGFLYFFYFQTHWRKFSHKVNSEVTKLCPTLCDPMDCSPPGLSVHGISRQEYLSGLSFPSPVDLPDPGIKLRSPTLQEHSLFKNVLALGLPSIFCLFWIYVFFEEKEIFSIIDTPFFISICRLHLS